MIHYGTLLQNATAILLQNATKVYYKMRQVFYYKMQQFYYKLRQYKTKEIPDLYFSKQTRFDLKSINRI